MMLLSLGILPGVTAKPCLVPVTGGFSVLPVAVFGPSLFLQFFDHLDVLVGFDECLATDGQLIGNYLLTSLHGLQLLRQSAGEVATGCRAIDVHLTSPEELTKHRELFAAPPFQRVSQFGKIPFMREKLGHQLPEHIAPITTVFQKPF